jgi:organic radical activating enzyme
MNTTCNYRCSYCTQRFLEDRTRWARDIPRFVEAFARLPGDWEVKLSGGEPFLHPELESLVHALVAQGRRLSVVTNASAPEALLDTWMDATRARPGVFSASLHLEHADLDRFEARLRRVAGRHRGPVVVTCVATRAALPRLPALRERFAPIPVRVQPEKQDREVIAYTPAERDAIGALGGHNGMGWIDPDFSGRPCWAGARYFILDDRGAAWRCYPARRARLEPLGDFLAPTFRLGLAAEPCRYHYCNCTVPQARGMIAGVGPVPGA